MEQPSPTNFLKKITDQPNSNQRIFDSSSPDSEIYQDHDTGRDGPQQDYILPVTKSIQKLKHDKRKYNNTSNELRLELIDAVENHGEKIKSAAKRLGINYSSAKAICQIYKREGRSNKKVLKRKTAKQQPEAQVTDEPVYFSPAPKPMQEQTVILNQDGENYKMSYSDPTGAPVMPTRDGLLESQANPLKEDGYMQEAKEPEIINQPMPTIDYNQGFPINSNIQNIQTEVKPPQQIDQRMNQNNNFLAPQMTRIQQPIQMLNNYPGGGFGPGYYYIQQGPMMQQPQIYSIGPNTTIIPVMYANQQSVQPQQQMQTFPVSFPQNPQQMNSIPMDQFQNREMNMNMNMDSNNSGFENNEKKNMNSSIPSIPSPNKFSNHNPSLIPQQSSEFSQPNNNFHYQQQSLMNNQMNGFQFINPTVYILPRGQNGMPAANFPQMISNTHVIRNTYSQQSNTITTQPGMVYYGGNNMPDFTNNSQDLAKNPPNSQI